MNWSELLSANRLGETGQIPLSETRSRFEQDFDRIIFSHPFRKLQDKTQVFPMPEDDFVHTRLTHSLEVSSVGRSLGKEVGKVLVDRHKLGREGIEYHEFGAITAAASLAHDLGNPPFGHSGELGISNYFLNTSAGNRFKKIVEPSEWSDVTRFEGNAQGFRILNGNRYGGLKLTTATLAAFTKYPKSSFTIADKKRQSQKKYGFTQSELDLFHSIATETGLINAGDQKWVRHPLAFLVEAADDICYHIIDLEDGARLGLVPLDQTTDLLASIIGKKFSREKFERIGDINEKLGILRAMAINELVLQCVACFLENEKDILEGSYDESLVENIEASHTLHRIKVLSIEKIYRSRIVLEREATGFEVIEKLMERFVEAMFMKKFDPNKFSPRLKSVYRLLPEPYKNQLVGEELSEFQSLQVIIDYISSLTDTTAIKLYRIISGFAT